MSLKVSCNLCKGNRFAGGKIFDWEMEKVQLPKYLKADSMGTWQLKGKQQQVELVSVTCLSVNGQKRTQKVIQEKDPEN